MPGDGGSSRPVKVIVKNANGKVIGITKPIDKNIIPSEFTSLIRPNEKLKLDKIYTDTVNYVDFNTDYDDWYFLVEKNKDTISLIYNNEENIKLVKGDELVIEWKMDSLRNPGDPEFLHFSEFLMSSKKKKSNQSSTIVIENSSTFVVSCGSGCAMRYSENEIITNDNSIEVKFKVEIYVNEVIDDAYYETCIFICDASKKVEQIKFKGTKNFEIGVMPPEFQKKPKVLCFSIV